MSSAWLLNVLATLMLVVAVVSATRLATAYWPANWSSAARLAGSRSSQRTWDRVGIDITNLLMCIAMTGMLSHNIRTLPPRTWEVIFSLLTAWFARRSISSARVNGFRSIVSGNGVVHLLHCAATLYMFSAMTTPYGMELTWVVCGSAVPSINHSVLAWVFTLLLAGYSAWDIVGQLSRRRYSPARGPSASATPIDATLPAVACRLAMGVTMVFMLAMT